MGFKTKEAALAYHKRWRDANKAHCAEYRKRYRGKRGPAHRRDRYGLSPEDFNRMVDEQNGRCMLCMNIPDGDGPMGVLHVDHDHATGSVRDLLCQKCNKALGGFQDDTGLLARAIWYLQRHRAAHRNTA
jgi:hypothetical protein